MVTLEQIHEDILGLKKEINELKQSLHKPKIQGNLFQETFGKLRHWKKPTEQIMDEVDAELWGE